jgi:choline dehydrogenase-like flavoprotein
VLVLEFGIADRSNTTLWPFNAQALNIGAMFNISSAPEPHMGGARYSIRAGSIAGGGSSVNGMELDRASAADYDSFGQLENGRWNWKNLLGYFKKVSWSSKGASDRSQT